MKSVITFFAAVMIAATPALGKSSAPVCKPEIWEFNGNVIRSSIKCELSRVAREIKEIASNKNTAKVKVKLVNTREDSLKIPFDIPRLFAKPNYRSEKTVVVGEEIEIVYNISFENGKNCTKNNKFNAWIYDCLRDKSDIFRDKSDRSSAIKCNTSIDVKRVISSEANVKVWVIDIGPSLSSSEKGVYSFEISVPPSKD